MIEMYNDIYHDYLLTGFRRWCEDMLIPDESFYSTLLHITSVKDHGQSKNAKIGHLLDDLEKRYIFLFVVNGKIRRITRPRFAIHQKLAASEFICV